MRQPRGVEVPKDRGYSSTITREIKLYTSSREREEV